MVTCIWHLTNLVQFALSWSMDEAVNRITLARRRLNVDQAKLAEMLGVHRSTVTRWEAGTSKIKGPILRLLDSLESQPPQTGAA